MALGVIAVNAAYASGGKSVINVCVHHANGDLYKARWVGLISQAIG